MGNIIVNNSLSGVNVIYKGVTHNINEIRTIKNNITTTVWTASRTVTYCVDQNITYREEVRNGQSCLSPSTFVPTMEGWTFVGWRSDNTATSSVYSECVMGNSAITLYAVFMRNVVITYYNNSTSAATISKPFYYNNGNINNPTFTLTQATKSGWTARGWSTSNYSEASVSYSNGVSFSISGFSLTLYGLYQKTGTATFYYMNSSSGTTALNQTLNTTVYYNSSGDISSVGVTPSISSSYQYYGEHIGWTDSLSATESVDWEDGDEFTLGIESPKIYALYKKGFTTTYSGNGATSGSMAASTRYYYLNASGNSYYDKIVFPKCTFSKSGYSFNGWTLNGTTYKEGDVYNNVYPSNITITANWLSDTFTLFETADSTAYNNPYYGWQMYATGQLGSNLVVDKVSNIDCTNYKYCTVRAYARDLECLPSGGVQDNIYIYLGFGSDSTKNSTMVARKTNGTTMGTYGEGVCYNQWADVEIDISNLTGKNTLNCMSKVESGFGSGAIWTYISKVVLHN